MQYSRTSSFLLEVLFYAIYRAGDNRSGTAV
nr:MAG TPA: hypothetical protein [Caudoviricetes sp.]